MGEMMEYLELEIAAQQKQLYNAYIRIRELNHEINILKKQVNGKISPSGLVLVQLIFIHLKLQETWSEKWIFHLLKNGILKRMRLM